MGFVNESERAGCGAAKRQTDIGAKDVSRIDGSRAVGNRKHFQLLYRWTIGREAARVRRGLSAELFQALVAIAFHFLDASFQILVGFGCKQFFRDIQVATDNLVHST